MKFEIPTMKNTILTFGIASLLLFSCKKKEKEEEIKTNTFTTELAFDLYFGGQKVESPASIFSLENGDKVKLTSFKILFNDLHLGGQVLSDAVFYDFPNDYNNVFLKKNSSTFYTGDLAIKLGVDRDKNHNDPTLFPLESPMNILNASDMHWSWNPGYIFYKMELIMDTSRIENEAHFNLPISYHIGLDNNFYKLEVPNVVQHSVSTDTKRIKLKLDFKEMLFGDNPPTDLKTEGISHSTGPQADIAVRVARAFHQNLTVE